MAQIHIQRPHQLGLAGARKVAWQWAEQAEAVGSLGPGPLRKRGVAVDQFQRGDVVDHREAEDRRARLRPDDRRAA